MRRLTLVALGLLVACSGPALETRTFQLKYLRGEEAIEILRPYVSGTSGEISTRGALITVRGTPENVEKIGGVLAQHDRPAPSVQLHFQIIEADGVTRVDPAITEVEQALRKLFRFRGYRLVGEAVASGTAYSESSQRVAGAGEYYQIVARIGEVSGSGDSSIVRLETFLNVPRFGEALRASVSLRAGQTAVLGNARLDPQGATLILTVRPELVPN